MSSRPLGMGVRALREDPVHPKDNALLVFIFGWVIRKKTAEVSFDTVDGPAWGVDQNSQPTSQTPACAEKDKKNI